MPLPIARRQPSAVDAPLARDVRRGLLATPKRLPALYFYDDLGSALFEAICRLPWYEVTRAELRLLAAHAPAIARAAGAARMTELGPGHGEKLAVLARAATAGGRALPVHLVDISQAALDGAARALGEIPGVSVSTDRATYHDGLRRADRVRPPFGRALVLFLGSNIGNFDPDESQALLADIRAALAPGDRLLLGTDLVKPAERLLLAYDDPLGVTAAFNRNVLVRINRELGADFPVERFAHEARWDAAAARVEMHLVSLDARTVSIPGAACRVSFAAGESIWTESSYKYDPGRIDSMGTRAGFALHERWIDDPGGFALTLFTAV